MSGNVIRKLFKDDPRFERYTNGEIVLASGFVLFNIIVITSLTLNVWMSDWSDSARCTVLLGLAHFVAPTFSRTSIRLGTISLLALTLALIFGV